MSLRSLAPAALALLALVACSPSRPDRRGGGDDDPCERPCGELCCEEGEACQEGACVPCEPTTCEAAGRSCGSLDDGCGVTLECGACAAGLTCGGGGKEGACGANGCTPETDAELCRKAGRQCGPITATDSCGNERKVASCGTCTAPATCGGSGRTGICGVPGEPCVPETDKGFCERLGRDCGPLSDFDNCESVRSVVTCGNCASPKTCGGGGREGACGCTGEKEVDLCAANGAECGSLRVTDRCGVSRSLSCGTCRAPASCGGAGAANRCGCTGETDAELCAAANAECGSVTRTDRCGRSRTVSCGSCVSPHRCGDTAPNRCGCTGETDAQLCTAAGAKCGTISRTDKCGRARTPSCGTCSLPETCGGGGRANQCGCTDSRTDAQFCSEAGHECGSATVTDRCGVARSLSSCGTCTLPETCGARYWEPNQCDCVAESDEELCSAAGYECGTLTKTDKCRQARTMECGTCQTNWTCGANHRCSCVKETDAAFCARFKRNCGMFAGKDNCGVDRTVNCGVCGAGTTCSARNVCSAWTQVSVSNSLDYSAVHGLSATEVYFVGDSEHSTNPRLVKWDGANVSYSAVVTATGVTLSALHAVWGPPGGPLYFAGSGKDSAGKWHGVLLHSPGGGGWKAFTQLRTRPGAVWGIHGTAANNLWTTHPGFASWQVAPGIARNDGLSWSEITIPASVGMDPDAMLNGIHVFSESDVFVVGNSEDKVFRWNGTALSSMPVPQGHTGFFDVWGSSPNDVWASGSDGKIAHWNGSVWEDRSLNTSAWIYGIDGSGPNDVWAVGTGFIAHWTGTAWVEEASPTTGFLNDVWVGPTEIWAVGNGVVIRRPRP